MRKFIAGYLTGSLIAVLSLTIFVQRLIYRFDLIEGEARYQEALDDLQERAHIKAFALAELKESAFDDVDGDGNPYPYEPLDLDNQVGPLDDLAERKELQRKHDIHTYRMNNLISALYSDEQVEALIRQEDQQAFIASHEHDRAVNYGLTDASQGWLKRHVA